MCPEVRYMQTCCALHFTLCLEGRGQKAYFFLFIIIHKYDTYEMTNQTVGHLISRALWSTL